MSQCELFSTHISVYKTYFPSWFSLLCRVKNEFVICKRSDMFAKKVNLIHSPPFDHLMSGKVRWAIHQLLFGGWLNSWTQLSPGPQAPDWFALKIVILIDMRWAQQYNRPIIMSIWSAGDRWIRLKLDEDWFLGEFLRGWGTSLF